MVSRHWTSKSTASKSTSTIYLTKFALYNVLVFNIYLLNIQCPVKAEKHILNFRLVKKNRTNGLCKLCDQNCKDQIGIFSNFLKHLKHIHANEYNRIFNPEDEFSSEGKHANGNDLIVADLTSSKHKQNRYILSNAKNLIIRCNLPLNYVESVGFRDFMKECSFKCESISIHEALNNVNHLTLTINGWSDRRCRSFLGITCHFTDDKMMTQAYLIDFVRLKSPHTAENIQQLTDDVLDRFHIEEKVFKIITGNASSMIKTCKFGLLVDEEADMHSDKE
ncbi:unnamed protein product [Rotaria magnacalcarata]|uniref:C2H2-type domain-containing protein n=1 Tax=Rotaria magnacalcarata TaxID=392030 RepID=A0A819QE99_9BILA|nr:unnamed protein product [Rotaria magnacalcarata]CAF4027484.1 unnamed protein product [Rotaria magnacalcarata]